MQAELNVFLPVSVVDASVAAVEGDGQIVRLDHPQVRRTTRVEGAAGAIVRVRRRPHGVTTGVGVDASPAARVGES